MRCKTTAGTRVNPSKNGLTRLLDPRQAFTLTIFIYDLAADPHTRAARQQQALHTALPSLRLLDPRNASVGDHAARSRGQLE